MPYSQIKLYSPGAQYVLNQVLRVFMQIFELFVCLQIRWCSTTATASYGAKNWRTTYSSRYPLKKRPSIQLIRQLKNERFDRQHQSNIVINQHLNFTESKQLIKFRTFNAWIVYKERTIQRASQQLVQGEGEKNISKTAVTQK